MNPTPLILFAATALAVVTTGSASPVINEIMFHPQGAPAEDPAQEWIELYNNGPMTLGMSGWTISKGVTFTFPEGTTLAPGAYLVVAADVAVFQAAHAGFSGQLVGGWTGRLSNSGEQIQIDDALGVKVNDVTFADEGDWALRARSAASYSHQGWEWVNDADGFGRTIELRNPALGNGCGQNWGLSTAAGGTPGAANSLASTDVAPLIKDVKHRPEIPKATDPIVVSCNLEDETAADATLHWRLDAGTWQSLAMSDADGDGDVEATIPAQPDLAIIEWYISAGDGANTRTWPAPARTSDPGVTPETFGQVTNALLQVDDSFDPGLNFTVAGNQPIYRFIMTAAERNELVTLQTTSGQEDSEATFNGTFISHDGTGLKVVYNAGYRNRGFGSALGPPNNYHVGFRSDDRWNGRETMQVNCQYVYAQALGNAVYSLAGIPPQECAVIRVRVNGVDLAQTGTRMYGRYVRLEGRGGDWAERHYPNDSEGNFYRCDDHDTGGVNPPGDLGSGEFRFEGTDPNAYNDTFWKETNQDANDYGDLADFCRIVSAPATGGTAGQPAISNADYPAAVAGVLDIDQFYRFIAVDALLGNQEGGLQSGRTDDVSLYCGLGDPRFRFIPHDLDDVFDIGGGSGDPLTRSIFSYDGGTSPGTGVLGLTRLFNHPQLLPRYYAAVLDAMDTWFNHATLDPLIEQLMGGWVPVTDSTPGVSPARGITEIKAYIDARRTNVLAQIPQTYSLTVTADSTTSEGYQRTNDGSATFSGIFNVARTCSITVNGVPVTTMNYRTTATLTAGTWSHTVAAGGGGVLKPGLNHVVVQFWDAPDGTGNALQTLTSLVQYAATANEVSGMLSPPGSLTMIAPAGYLPGLPILVRVDLKDAGGDLDREAWNRTATLTATNGVTLTPATITLCNGIGSALVMPGTGGSTTQTLFSYGTGGTGTAGSGVPGSTWKGLVDLTTAAIGGVPSTWKDEGFDDSAWVNLATQTGYGNSDENTPFADIDYDPDTTGSQNVPSYLFRNTFDVADVTKVTSVTGQIKYDDAYAIYVNGQEVQRSANLPAGTALSSYATGTSSDNATASVTIPPNLLHNGANTIAVEIHQAHSTSTDVTFDLRLAATLTVTDPGDFTLTANVGGTTAAKAIASLQGQTPTPVSGTLPAGPNTWSGIVQVSGDVTVPAGATLTIQPGTHVLVDGTAFGGGGSAGFDLIVASGGTLNAPGTPAQPISITCSNASNRWGELSFQSGANSALLQYCLISRACHSPGGGHTGTGPMVRLAGTTIAFEDCVLSDSPGKTLTNTGNCDITFRRTHCARGVMGPELDGSALLIEDSNFTDMLDTYRESGAQDDEDGIYIHDSGGRTVLLSRSVFANTKDDAVDLLAGSLTIDDCIIRDAFDKGISLLRNDTLIRRSRIIDCDIGISSKTDEAHKDTPYTTTLENVTIVCEEHPTNTSDGTAHSTGIHTRNKYGTTGANLPWIVKDTIISAIKPVANDYGVTGDLFPQMTINYTCYNDLNPATLQEPVPAGTGNIETDPLYLSFANNDFKLTETSPARDAGDPASPPDPDSSRADMGALPYDLAEPGTGTVVWSPAGSPYHVTDNLTVPAGLTLQIQPGTSVYVAQNKRITVNGRILAQGSPDAHIVFSHAPGTVAGGDCDPIKNGTQTGPPKWGGLRVYDSMAEENVLSYCDFINAQGTSPAGSENYGSLGFIRSWGWADHCTWSGSHLRWCYARNAKITVTHCLFPDMFDATEAPPADFISGADNNQEQLKMDFPTTDAELAGNPNFVSGFPVGGWCRVYYNDFHGNKGHNDVFDGSGGRVGTTFPLDCRYNHFHGLTGDEHLDLDGDCYIAGNILEHGTKDIWTSDSGYSNAISTGGRGAGTTMMVARNLCFDMDHLLNCKAQVAGWVEHNTIANLHADFHFSDSVYGIEQDVKCSVVNMLVPNDGPTPERGDGCYLGYNLISGVPRLISDPDTRQTALNTWLHDVTTRIEFNQNICDQITDASIGVNHPGTIYASAYGTNLQAAADFVDPANKDYTLQAGATARGAGPAGIDIGWTCAEWAYIDGGPANTTGSTAATFTVGGPGLIAYKWRLDGGAWSSPVTIGAGAVFDRTNPTVRTGTISLSELTTGPHTLEVLGMDFAGNWQDADPAKTYTGQAQFGPTTRTWTVNPAATLVRINEVLADGTVLPDTIELHNAGASSVSLSGWALTDDPATPAKYAFPAGTSLAAGGYLSVPNTTSAINLDKDGDAVFLYQSGALRDSVAFGHQIPDHTIGRVGPAAQWALCTPTPGGANVAARLGDTGTLRINEWLASGNVLYDNDWIELSNIGALPVALAGLSLTDNIAGDPAAHTIAPLSFIAAGGYLKFIADGDPDTGATHLAFKLDAEQEQIALLDGATRLDAVFFYQQTTDVSMGREGAVATGFDFYELPTAGFVNGTGDPAYANALAILRGLRITEIMYNAAGGNDYEYVELRNVGAIALQLAGVKFVNGIDFTFPTFTLNPGQNVLVVKNLTKFLQRYGSGPNVGGVYGGQLDNSGEGLALQLPPPFDANVLTFTFNDTWQVNTDGKSKSLVVVDPLASAGDWGDGDTWVESDSPYGDPDGHAIAAPDHLAPWLGYYSVPSAVDDSDHDGMSAELEFAIGTHPGTASNSSSPWPALALDRVLEFHFTLPENLTVTQNQGQPGVIYAVQACDDLAGWTTIATKTATTTWAGAATVSVGAPVNGFIPVMVRDIAPAGASRFMRLQVSTP